MPLFVGDKLGPYEILAPLGAGGMGEAYKARDPRLNRIVANKRLKGQHSAASRRRLTPSRRSIRIAETSTPDSSQSDNLYLSREQRVYRRMSEALRPSRSVMPQIDADMLGCRAHVAHAPL
jgi:serine/threonine protein kinase